MLFPAIKWIVLTGPAVALAFLRRVYWLDPRRLARDSSGQMLIEVVLAITIFAAVGTSVLLGVRVAHTSASLVENHSIAERLARNQIESVFNQAYKPPNVDGTAADYVTLAEAEACGSNTGYSICATGEKLQSADGAELEKVVVTVNLNGREVLKLETLRGK